MYLHVIRSVEVLFYKTYVALIFVLFSQVFSNLSQLSFLSYKYRVDIFNIKEKRLLLMRFVSFVNDFFYP